MLTLFSIIAAIAMMTMLMTCFTTMESCIRARNYDKQPYHVRYAFVTEEKAEKVRAYPGITACNLVKMEDSREGGELLDFIKGGGIQITETYYFADLMLTPGFSGVLNEYLKEMVEQTHLAPEWYTAAGETFSVHEYNEKLIENDVVGLDAHYQQVMTVATYFIYVVALALILRLIIDTAFEVSSKERERQFGVLQSVGATPKQIVGIITYEGMMLSAVGVPFGIGIGLALGYLIFRLVLGSGLIESFFTSREHALEILQYRIRPEIVAVCAVVGVVWVFLSAYGTGTRVVKMSPVQAISNRSNTVKKVRRFSLFGMLFGWVGKLASRNTRRQMKRFVITVLTVSISVSMFAMFGVLLEQAQTTAEKMVETYDSIGSHHYDFDLVSMTLLGDPLSYRSGVKALEECPYLESVEHWFHLNGYSSDSEEHPIYYMNEVAYNRMFKYEKKPLSFKELEQSGGYLVLNPKGVSVLPAYQKNVDLEIRCYTKNDMTKEQYEALPPEEKANYAEIMGAERYGFGWDEDRPFVYCYADKKTEKHTFPIAAFAETPDTFQGMPGSRNGGLSYVLIAPVSRYESNDYAYFGDQPHMDRISAALHSNEDHKAALNYINKHLDVLDKPNDQFDIMNKIRSVVNAFSIGIRFFVLMFAIIAVIHMVNIVSTGLLNRSGEMASMQCIGMTRGQLYRMAAVECLQYVLLAGVFAVILCALMVFGTNEFLAYLDIFEEMQRKIVGYAEPMLRVAIGTAAALGVALITTLLSLHKAEKRALVDRVRGTE